MIPESSPSPPPAPVIAGVFSGGAGLLHLFFALLLLGVGVPGGPALMGMSALLGYGALFGLLVGRLGEGPGRALALVTPPRGYRLAIVLLLPSVLLVSEIDNLTLALLPAAETPELEDVPASWTYQIALVQIIVFPMVYELFFRGMIQPLLVGALGPLRGIGLTAVYNGAATALALVHPRAFPTTVAAACLLGFLRHRTGSLVPPLLLHSLTGLITLGAHLELFGIGGFDDLDQAHTPLGWLLLAAGATAAGISRCRRLTPVPAPSPASDDPD